MLWMMLSVSAVSAANIGDGVQRLPIVTEDDKTLGWVQLDRRESSLSMDFDLDQPVNCKLTNVRTHIRMEAENTTQDSRLIRVFEVANERSFDRVRDAQITIEMPDSQNREISYFSSQARFDCDGKRVETLIGDSQEHTTIISRIKTKIDNAWDNWRWTRPMFTKGPTENQTYWIDNAWNDWIWD